MRAFDLLSALIDELIPMSRPLLNLAARLTVFAIPLALLYWRGQRQERKREQQQFI